MPSIAVFILWNNFRFDMVRIAQNARMGSWTHEFQDGRIKLRYPFLHNRQPRTYDPRSRVIALHKGKCIAANMRVPCQMDGPIFCVSFVAHILQLCAGVNQASGSLEAVDEHEVIPCPRCGPEVLQ